LGPRTARTTGNRADDLQTVGVGDLGLTVDAFAAHEHGDVLANPTLIVEHPAGKPRMRALETTERLLDGRALYGDLTPSIGALSKRRAEPDDCHWTGV
jgi:hypothetical protein